MRLGRSAQGVERLPAVVILPPRAIVRIPSFGARISAGRKAASTAFTRTDQAYVTTTTERDRNAAPVLRKSHPH
jgi:hypothetical protein